MAIIEKISNTDIAFVTAIRDDVTTDNWEVEPMLIRKGVILDEKDRDPKKC